MTTLRVDLGGIACELSVPEQAGAVLAERYARYATERAPELRCEVSVVPSLPRIEVPAYPAARVSVEPGRGNVRRIERTDLDARFEVDAGRLHVRVAGNPLVVEAALRIAVSTLLPRLRGGLLLHASGVVEPARVGGAFEPRGFVFSGHSGAGKTTMVRLLAPRPPLGDDLLALLPDGAGGIVARSTPFAGEHGVVAPLDAPLARLHFLQQAAEDRMIPISEADARTHVLRNTLAYVRDAEQAGLLQDAAARLAAAVPAVRLRFRKSADIADVLFPRDPNGTAA